MDSVIFSVIKPKGITSYQVIEKVKELIGKEKVGHAGTLDPLASGILVIAIGRQATKQLPEITLKEKEYVACIKLGQESSTHDEEGEKTLIEVKKIPEETEIRKALESFVGFTEQTPPKFSAVKVKGKRAYELARKGKDFELAPKTVFIKEIELIEFNYPLIKARIVCGKGTYIRSLARDLGEKLRTGAYITELERTSIGEFSKENSLELSELSKFLEKTG